MTREEFDTLIRRCEKVSQESPRLYVARVVGLVVMAYGYLLLVLLGSLALCLLMLGLMFYLPVTLKLDLIGLVAFGGIFLAVLRGLWVRLEPPKGQLVTRAQAPKLFALLDDLRATLDCRPFHRVLIVNELNASVMQIPRLGVFGWHQNYLLLGLPLLECLSPEEFRAVLAHEFAHSSQGHGSFGNWLYRVRQTWAQVFEQMAGRRTRWDVMLTHFVAWFWPQFNGHAFVLARANEYVADAWAVRVAGAEVMGRALTRLPITAALMGEKFWPDILRRANVTDLPPDDVVKELQQALRRGPTDQDAVRWLREACLVETGNVDTHPCLKERLRAMGCPELRPEAPPLPAPVRVSAAEEFLGELVTAAERRFSDEWFTTIKQPWQKRHAEIQRLAAELAAMDKPEVPPGIAQIWEMAVKHVNLHGDEAAVGLLERVLALEPRHAGANFILGRKRLHEDDPHGVELMEIAVGTDPWLTPRGSELLHAYFSRNMQPERLRPWEQRLDQFQEFSTLAEQERGTVIESDIFLEHGLNPQQVERLRTLLALNKEISSAAVVRKQVRHFPDSRSFVIALTLDVAEGKPPHADSPQTMTEQLAQSAHLPGHCLAFIAMGGLTKLGQKAYAVPDSVIYGVAP
ncbi:MAG TPA: M48 family metallopeptidase [Candidatus Limnocylindria bacterium]|jgi:Zn-dependent protease with chaperone function|nr:M48 family metallopeptidase [Candidatus Limnocylindria bacterium]